MSKKQQVEVFTEDVKVTLTLGAGFIQELNNLLIYFMDLHSEDQLKKMDLDIASVMKSEDYNRTLSPEAAAFRTLLILQLEIENNAREKGMLVLHEIDVENPNDLENVEEV